ncbi:MAG: peptide transporter [Chitinivibrionales bacterium]|nr:peptide transporter [Chitinivibrionales bacterium]
MAEMKKNNDNGMPHLMEVPSHFEEGFNWLSFIGAAFVALVMVPGSIYLHLLAGVSIGPASQWVTIIMFIEVARRANKSLKNAEIYILFFLAGQAAFLPFEGILWNQFLKQSNAALSLGITDDIPSWFAPKSREVLDKRSLFQAEWIPAILLVTFHVFMSRINNAVIGYGLFRLASDVEKLPFPMANVGAQGILALSEEQEEEKQVSSGGEDEDKPKMSWRWRVFSIGGALGLVFGALYLGLPTISGAILDRPLVIFPIPFIDYTQETGSFLPAVATGISLDMTNLILGMVLPFWAMVGSAAGFLVTWIINPFVLYPMGVLTQWNQGDDTIMTLMKNNVDFYFSFTIGTTIAVFIVGILATVKKVLEARKKASTTGKDKPVFESMAPEGRGDIRFPYIIVVYIMTTLAYILLSGWLIEWHRGVMAVLFFFGFVYTPLISYVTARLEGITGEVVTPPLIREAAFILSGFKGITVWFLPIPVDNFGVATVGYRQAELTGTKFVSKWKALLVFTPLILITSLFFANFIWSLGPIPSPQFPYADRMWELQAEMKSLMFSSTLEGFTLFERAFEPLNIAIGFIFGAIGFGAVTVLGLPVFIMYGMVRGISNQTLPHVIIPQFIGALIGRFYFKKKLGLRWGQYIPVIMAGFSCGMGLLTTLCIGVTFLIKSVIKLPF